jgi:transcriptional regulator with XRE-family HTH domain
MPTTINKNDWNAMSNTAITRELGRSLKQWRIQKNLTQREISERTGLDRSTISQTENGRVSSVVTFIQILRALEKLDLLNTFNVQLIISPLQMAKIEANTRKKASSSKKNKPQKKNSEW